MVKLGAGGVLTAETAARVAARKLPFWLPRL
jgi:hypothetical protein